MTDVATTRSRPTAGAPGGSIGIPNAVSKACRGPGGATNAYDVFFASGVDLYLKLGIVASAVGFVLSKRYRTFAFVMMIAFQLDELYAAPTLHDEDRRALGEAYPQLEAAASAATSSR